MAGIKDRGIKLGMKAVGKLLEKPERADSVMRAVQKVQGAREKVDATTARLLNLSNIPSREDIKGLSRRIGKLRRQGKKILASIDDIEALLDDAGGR